MNTAVLLVSWLLAASPEPVPGGTGHQLLCAEFNAGQVIAQSTGHQLHATLAWTADKPVSRSRDHLLLRGCTASRFSPELFDALFADRFQF